MKTYRIVGLYQTPGACDLAIGDVFLEFGSGAWRWADADLIRASEGIDADIINSAIRAGARL